MLFLSIAGEDGHLSNGRYNAGESMLDHRSL